LRNARQGRDYGMMEKNVLEQCERDGQGTKKNNAVGFEKARADDERGGGNIESRRDVPFAFGKGPSRKTEGRYPI